MLCGNGQIGPDYFVRTIREVELKDSRACCSGLSASHHDSFVPTASELPRSVLIFLEDGAKNKSATHHHERNHLLLTRLIGPADLGRKAIQDADLDVPLKLNLNARAWSDLRAAPMPQ